MKKWHYPLLFLIIVIAVAVGVNSRFLYNSTMLTLTGDCAYWRDGSSDELWDETSRKKMSTQELTCSLRDYFNRQKIINEGH